MGVNATTVRPDMVDELLESHLRLDEAVRHFHGDPGAPMRAASVRATTGHLNRLALLATPMELARVSERRAAHRRMEGR